MINHVQSSDRVSSTRDPLVEPNLSCTLLCMLLRCLVHHPCPWPCNNTFLILRTHSTLELCSSSVDRRLAVKPRHGLVLSIILLHPFLVSFVLHFSCLASEEVEARLLFMAIVEIQRAHVVGGAYVVIIACLCTRKINFACGLRIHARPDKLAERVYFCSDKYLKWSDDRLLFQQWPSIDYRLGAGVLATLIIIHRSRWSSLLPASPPIHELQHILARGVLARHATFELVCYTFVPRRIILTHAGYWYATADTSGDRRSSESFCKQCVAMPAFPYDAMGT